MTIVLLFGVTAVMFGFTMLNMWCLTMDTLTDVRKTLVDVRHALDRVAYYTESEFSREFEEEESSGSVNGRM